MKNFIVSLAIVVVMGGAAVWAFAPTEKAEACGFFTPCENSSSAKEAKQLEDNQQRLINAVPIPSLQDSLERKNISKRAETFNKPDKISYIYFVSYGKVMAFYTVKGKVTSLNSYMTPQERLIDGYGNKCGSNSDGEGNTAINCFTVQAPDIDGSYGENANGIFFFTTEGAYVEWKGDYMMSDQPLKLTTQPELVREIQ